MSMWDNPAEIRRKQNRAAAEELAKKGKRLDDYPWPGDEEKESDTESQHSGKVIPLRKKG